MTEDQRRDAREKIVGIILTTMAALLCTAIDYFLNQED